MIDKAIEKINAEMQKNPADIYTEIIGHYIIDRCSDDITAAKIAADNKSMKGAMDAIMQKARAAAKGNVAALMPATVFGAVDQYFGIPTNEAAQESAMMTACGATETQKRVPAAKKVALDLADFL